MLHTSDFSKHVVDDECVLRNTQSHLQQCKLIEGSAGDVPSFSLFDGELPHDLMHDVFEGVLPVQAKLLLSLCISQGYFTFDYYSKQLLAFPYGYSDSNKPIPMTRRSLSLVINYISHRHRQCFLCKFYYY